MYKQIYTLTETGDLGRLLVVSPDWTSRSPPAAQEHRNALPMLREHHFRPLSFAEWKLYSSDHGKNRRTGNHKKKQSALKHDVVFRCFDWLAEDRRIWAPSSAVFSAAEETRRMPRLSSMGHHPSHFVFPIGSWTLPRPLSSHAFCYVPSCERGELWHIHSLATLLAPCREWHTMISARLALKSCVSIRIYFDILAFVIDSFGYEIY